MFLKLAKIALVSIIAPLFIVSNPKISSSQDGSDWKHYPYQPPGTKIEFPKDEGSHFSQPSTRMEGWYAFFHLTAQRTAKKYTVIVAFFYDIYTNRFTNVRFFHITDVTERAVISDTIYVGRLTSKEGYLDLRYKHGSKFDYWHTKRTPQGKFSPFQYHLEVKGSFRHPNIAIEFDMDTIKCPAIIGENGYVQMGESGNSWYYSLTRMKVMGTLNLHGRSEAVGEIGWMDHQWGPFFISPRSDRTDSYEWFGIQLDNGEDIIVSEIFRYNQVPKDGSHGGVAWFPRDGPSGKTLDYTLERLKFWQDPWTNNYYSCKWRLIIPQRSLNLVITSDMKNQTLDFIFPFWEGRCSVAGIQTINGVKRTVRGFALAELTHSFNFDKGDRLISSAQKTIMPTINISGSMETNNRMRIGGKREFAEDKIIISLKIESRLRFQTVAKTQLRLWDFPKRSKCKLELREAYVNYPGFLWNKLDVRIGKQRIVWGTADKIKPTDNLNPDDFSDPMDFGEKVPTNSLRATYHLNKFTSITGVFLPTFTSATLPKGDWLTTSILPLPAGVTIKEITESITLPEDKLINSMYAFKLTGKIFGYYTSLSYFQGREDVSAAKKITLSSVDSTIVNARVDGIYPRMKVIGYDLAGRIGNLEVWGEIGYFIPQKIEQEIILPTGATENKILKNPYVKYTVGGEHTFKNGIYLNAQFCHGFSDEREKSLSNLLLAKVAKKFFHDKVKLILRNIVEIEPERKNDLVSSLVISPEIVYYPTNATEIQLGCYLIEGKRDSKFGQFRKNDEIYLKFKHNF